jgi:hypothetical protein
MFQGSINFLDKTNKTNIVKTMKNRIVKILMERDGLTQKEAIDSYNEGLSALNEYLEAGDISSAQDVCEEFWGLEPDYLDDMLF